VNPWLRRLAEPPLALIKRDDIARAAARHRALDGRVLNIGSKNVRLGKQCTNLDCVAGPQVDVVGDAHDIARHFGPASFDTVILSAVLQYCENPRMVIDQTWEVLRPGGFMLIDAPFIQPYCPDGPDLWRFTAEGLRRLCKPQFEILEITASITAGPALAFAFQGLASRARSRFARVALGWGVSVFAFPLRYLRNVDLETAGAILLVARKPPQLSVAPVAGPQE
jgi:SAM-dependent methyltransferase